MTQVVTIAPVLKSVHVSCSPEHAFAVFTREIGSWWPLETHAIHPGEVTRGRLGGARRGRGLRDLGRTGRAATGRRCSPGRRPPASRSPGTSTPRRRRRPRSRCGSRRGRRHEGRPRAPVLGAARLDRSGDAGSVRQRGRLGGGAGAVRRDRRLRRLASGGALCLSTPHTPTSIGSSGGPSRRSTRRSSGRRRERTSPPPAPSSASAHQRSSKTYSAFSCSQE